MYKRVDESYQINANAIEAILNDEANPLNCIASIITDGALVLDIGAGNGLLARVLLEKKKKIVLDGIEPNPVASELARPFYQEVFVGYLEEFLDKIDLSSYDYIVLADVLEHTQDPYNFLFSIVSRITNKTRIILSVPNVAFASVRYSLYKGKFNYVDSGILEKTHLRFFTFDSLSQLFSQLHLHFTEIVYLQRSPFKTEIRIRPRSIMDLLFLSKILRDKLSVAYQFLFILSLENTNPKEIKKGAAGNNLIYYLWERILHYFKKSLSSK